MAAPVSTRNAPLPSAPATADAGTPRGPNPPSEPTYTPTRSSAGIASSPLGGLASLRLGPAAASPSSGPRFLPPAAHGDPRTAALPRPTHLQIHDRRALSGLRNHPSLESVHLKGDFTLEDLKALPATLRHLDLSECTGSAKSFRAITYLAGLPLESLNVAGAEIGDGGARLLAANPSLKSLNAASGGISASGARMLAESPTLESLDLTQNAIGDAGAKALAGSRSLRHLAVRNGLVTDVGTRALALNPALVSLDLGNLVTETGNQVEQDGYDKTANNITAQGAWALAQNRSLKSLSVQGNDLCGDDGVRALARNRTLTSLNVAFTNMTSASAKALADNPVLTSLSVRWNYGLDDAGAMELARSRSLTSLDARDTGMSARGALALAANARISVWHDHANPVRAPLGEPAQSGLAGDPGQASRTAPGGAIWSSAAQARHDSAEAPANSAMTASTREGFALIDPFFNRVARESGLNVQAPQEMPWTRLRPSASEANHGNASAHGVSAEGLTSSRMAASIREGLGLIDQYVDRMGREYGLPVRAPAAQPDSAAPVATQPTLPADVWQTIAAQADPRVRRTLSTVSKPLRDAALAATKHLTVWDKAAFSRLRNYPALESLSFHGPLSLEDLRALPPSVRHLDLSGCTGSAVSEAGLAYLARLPLASLDLSDTGIGNRGAQALAASASLTSLNLSGNGIGTAGAEALGRNTVLTALDISANPIRNAGAQALAGSRSLTSLELRSIGIENSGIEALAANTVLRSLDISGNDLSDQSAAALAANQTLTSLKANDCGLTNDMAQQLARIRSLRTLEVGSNSIGDAGVLTIARNASLRSLNLSRNPITPQGLYPLALSRTLKSLDVSRIGCGDRGALLLSGNRALTSLKLGFNRISSEGARGLAANRTLISLDLRGNTIDVAAARALANAEPLASLNVSDCRLDDAVACALAESRTLTSLDVSWNRLSHRAARALADNPVLASLDISHNDIGPEGAQALADSASLTFLDARANRIGEAGARLLEANTRMRGTPQNPHFLAQDVPE
ncbi:GALA protein [Ralstonia pseudosolanacearum]|uniref:GALA protein n=1 Tax=Ralstonia pseudosolanacearum TaxID=1310165 RepID=UPI0039C6167C